MSDPPAPIPARVPRLSYFFPAHNEEANLEGLVTEALETLPTLTALISRGARVIVCSHLGRPGGRPDLKYSLAPVAARLGRLLGQEVDFPGDIVGTQARAAIAALRPGGLVVLENLRFDEAETSKDDMARGYFADRLAAPVDLYVAVMGILLIRRVHEAGPGALDVDSGDFIEALHDVAVEP